MKPINRLSFLLAAGALMAAPALGQSFYKKISAPQFTPFNSATTHAYDGANLRRFSTIADGRFLHEFHLTDGALLQSLTFHACDTNATDNTGAFLFSYDIDGGNPTFVGGGATTGTPGCGSWNYDLTAAGYVVDNNLKHLALTVITDAGNSTTSFSSVGLTYGLPPPPLTPSFGDVPTTHPFFRYIELMKSLELSSGCGGGNFCPNRQITRGEMAVFEVKEHFLGH